MALGSALFEPRGGAGRGQCHGDSPGPLPAAAASIQWPRQVLTAPNSGQLGAHTAHTYSSPPGRPDWTKFQHFDNKFGPASPALIKWLFLFSQVLARGVRRVACNNKGVSATEPPRKAHLLSVYEPDTPLLLAHVEVLRAAARVRRQFACHGPTLVVVCCRQCPIFGAAKAPRRSSASSVQLSAASTRGGADAAEAEALSPSW